MSRFTRPPQLGSDRCGEIEGFERAQVDQVRLERRRQVGKALPVGAHVRVLERPRRPGRRGRSVQVGEEHRHVFRAAKARIAAFAVQDDRRHVRRGLEEDGVRHCQRLADRRRERRHRLVEALHDDARLEHEHVVVAPAAPRDGRGVFELVRDPAAESEREGCDAGVVQSRGEARDEAGVDSAGQRRRNGAGLRQARANGSLEPGAQPQPGQLLVAGGLLSREPPQPLVAHAGRTEDEVLSRQQLADPRDERVAPGQVPEGEVGGERLAPEDARHEPALEQSLQLGCEGDATACRLGVVEAAFAERIAGQVQRSVGIEPCDRERPLDFGQLSRSCEALQL